MKEYFFIKDYKNDEKLRRSFNQLATSVFGLNFEKWYELGFWNQKYIPYSFVDGDEVIANVSVNLMELTIEGENKQAIQIGTVMTHPKHRNKGLIRQLMNIILDEYKEVDFMYLFANEYVLDFYPKFGFERRNETNFYMDVHTSIHCSNLKKLDINHSNDFDLIKRLTHNRIPNSTILGTIHDQSLLMFYCIYVFADQIHYLEELDCILLYNIEQDELHLYDIISHTEFSLDDILNRIVTSKIKRVIFHFTPDKLSTNPSSVTEDRNLFIKPIKSDLSTTPIRFPITSIA